MWREATLEAFPEAEFRSPTQLADLAAAEQRLGRGLPAELRQLLLESNGIVGRSAVDTVWPVEQIVEQNLLFRSDASFAELYMPFDALLFFGDYLGRSLAEGGDDWYR